MLMVLYNKISGMRGVLYKGAVRILLGGIVFCLLNDTVIDWHARS